MSLARKMALATLKKAKANAGIKNKRLRAGWDERFRAAIDGCLAEPPTKHRAKLATLLTHNFQSYNDVSLLSA